jgi:hypothetical protein
MSMPGSDCKNFLLVDGVITRAGLITLIQPAFYFFCKVTIFASMSARKVHKVKLQAAKVITVVLVSVYALFSVGIIKATHFCMGREASVVIFSSEAKKCPCSLFAGEKDNCCDDEHELVRIENEQKVISALSVALPVWFELEKLYTAQFVAAATTSSGSAHLVSDPSPPGVPLFKIHCSFVFYDGGFMG